MQTLLNILASPRGNRSFSGLVAQAFVEAYAEVRPEDTVHTLDLWAAPLPEFDDLAAAGKYKILKGRPHSEEEARAWHNVVEVIERFRAADRYVISTPMWNFSVPYRLKHYIDIVVQPGLTFSYSPDQGYAGLLADRAVQLILTRGETYADVTADYLKPYLEQVFRFIGCRDVRSLVIEHTLGPDKTLAAMREEALVQAREAGRRFAEPRPAEGKEQP